MLVCVSIISTQSNPGAESLDKYKCNKGKILRTRINHVSSLTNYSVQIRQEAYILYKYAQKAKKEQKEARETQKEKY